MMVSGVSGITCININTDKPILLASGADERLQIGERITHGQGAGSRPEIGRQAAEEEYASAVASDAGRKALAMSEAERAAVLREKDFILHKLDMLNGKERDLVGEVSTLSASGESPAALAAELDSVNDRLEICIFQFHGNFIFVNRNTDISVNMSIFDRI